MDWQVSARRKRTNSPLRPIALVDLTISSKYRWMDSGHCDLLEFALIVLIHKLLESQCGVLGRFRKVLRIRRSSDQSLQCHHSPTLAPPRPIRSNSESPQSRLRQGPARGQSAPRRRNATRSLGVSDEKVRQAETWTIEGDNITQRIIIRKRSE